MLDRFFNDGNRNDDDARLRDRQALIRERMQAQGITEEEAARLVLSEEELAIGKREVRAGEVEVNKRVETERVRDDVTLRREEVEVERRPITNAYDAAGATIGEDESIRIPLHAEEAVVEKRVVPKEEIVVRKHDVADTEMVEADLRRERAEVHSEGRVREAEGLRDDRDLRR
jgi:uncharacterized protein (TIGR02271 family)